MRFYSEPGRAAVIGPLGSAQGCGPLRCLFFDMPVIQRVTARPARPAEVIDLVHIFRTCDFHHMTITLNNKFTLFSLTLQSLVTIRCPKDFNPEVRAQCQSTTLIPPITWFNMVPTFLQEVEGSGIVTWVLWKSRSMRQLFLEVWGCYSACTKGKQEMGLLQTLYGTFQLLWIY